MLGCFFAFRQPENCFLIDFSKVSQRILIHITGETRPYPYFKLYDSEIGWNFSYEYIRLYKNGRLIPRQKYQFNSVYSYPTLMIMEACEPNDYIMLDIAPYRYKEVFFQEEL